MTRPRTAANAGRLALALLPDEQLLERLADVDASLRRLHGRSSDLALAMRQRLLVIRGELQREADRRQAA
jgi:hypothetical protein